MNSKKYLQSIIEESLFYKPRIAPLIVAGIIAAVGSIASSLISSSSTKKANEANIGMAGSANAITNQQWGAEMEQRNKEFNRTMRFNQKKQLEDMINSSPKFKKSFIDIWGGGI